jgi:hypothetical protein
MKFTAEQLEQIREVVTAPFQQFEITLLSKEIIVVQAHSMQPVGEYGVMFFRRVFDALNGVDSVVWRYINNVHDVQNATDFENVPSIPRLKLN